MTTRPDPTAADEIAGMRGKRTRDRYEDANGNLRHTRSEGQRLLLNYPATYDELQHKIGASRQSILDWKKGARVPFIHARRRMFTTLGIPVEAWSKPWSTTDTTARIRADVAGTPPPPLASTAATPPVAAVFNALGVAVPPAPAVPPDAPVAPAPEPLPVAIGGTSIEQCLGLLAVIRADRAAPNLLPSERVKLVDSESKLLRLLADLQSRAELTEDRYVREHPAWLRARNAIADALKAHPAAAQAVAAALDRLGL